MKSQDSFDMNNIAHQVVADALNKGNLLLPLQQKKPPLASS
jgi:hypothetical protein